MSTIAAWIIARLGWPALLILGGLAFYEGVPVLNSIPFVDRIPGVESVIVGRVGRAQAEGAEIERAIWEKKAWAKERQFERDRRLAQMKIDQVATDSLKREISLAIQMSALEQQLEKENANETSGACIGPVFSDGLSKRLDAVGRN